jgi:hypothetical protein
MMQHFITTLGIVGSIASVIALLLPATGWRTKVIHVIYGLVIAVLGIGVTYYQSELAESTIIATQANHLREYRDESKHSSNPDEQDRGFILATLTFFEKYRSRFPDTYERAKQLSDKTGVLNTDSNYYLHEVADTFDALLHGVASGAMN